MTAKEALQNIIKKARVHFYKPIQIAEILYRARVFNDLDLDDFQTYRNASKKWRDEICVEFIGRVSTSSAKYQDDIFTETAMPPRQIKELAIINNAHKGIVEKFIYESFAQKQMQLTRAISYCRDSTKDNFDLKFLIDSFRKEAGLKKSIDKIYEIIVYSLFTVIVEALNLTVKVSMDEKKLEILEEFEDFAKAVININLANHSFTTLAKLHRVGVTNAADRGLDMYGNFGIAIQIKHLTLDEELSESIADSISSDRIVIVCRDADEKIILSILTQIGWKAKIQSVVTESDLIKWYKKALRGKFSNILGDRLLFLLINEIVNEFPALDISKFKDFMNERGYDKIHDTF